MSRPVIGFLALALLTFAACGDEESLPAIETLFPADNELGGWVEDTADPENGAAGVEVASDAHGAELLINGAAEPFMQHDVAGFGVEYYIDGSHTCELCVWQMANPGAAENVYTGLRNDVGAYQNSSWSDVSLGDAGRKADTGSTWWYNVRQNVYHVEVKVRAIQTADHAAGEAKANEIAEWVIGKMP